MIKDPILEELWKHREEYAAKFNYDIDAIFLDLKKKEKESERIFISAPPKRASENAQTSDTTISRKAA